MGPVVARALLITLAALLFVGAFYYRQNHLGAFLCRETPEVCTLDRLMWIDRFFAEAPGDIRNQRFSDITQHAAVVWVLVLVWMWAMQEGMKVWTKVSLLFFAVLLNSGVNELVRILFPRPRPYVLHNLEVSGFLPGDYTSFFSGHTSFVAVLMAVATFQLKSNSLGKTWLRSHAWVAFLLISLTAYNRVLGGQHYMTDVLFAFVAGMWVAWLSVRIERKFVSL